MYGWSPSVLPLEQSLISESRRPTFVETVIEGNLHRTECEVSKQIESGRERLTVTALAIRFRSQSRAMC
jgi:hypothetical protein